METTSEFKTCFADAKESYQEALRSLFAGNPEETEADLSKLFTPTFTMREGSDVMDYKTFVKHMRWLRENVPKVSLTTEQFLRDGNQLAERHSSMTTMPDGTLARAETLQFAEIADDGRVAWIVELVQRGISHV